MRSANWILAAALLIGGVSFARQESETDLLKAIMDQHLNAINTAQSEAIARHHLPGHSEFGVTGDKLGISGTYEEQFVRNEGIFAGGFTFDWHNKDLRVQLFDNTALVTGYVVGITTAPDGTVSEINNRRTTVLVKVDGMWKEIHVHNSKLTETE